MNKTQAIEAINSGQAIRHRYFEDHEHVKLAPASDDKDSDVTEYIFENGGRQTAEEFWSIRTNPCFDEGWEIVNVDNHD